MALALTPLGVTYVRTGIQKELEVSRGTENYLDEVKFSDKSNCPQKSKVQLD